MDPSSPPLKLSDPDYRERMRAIHALVEQGQRQAGHWIRPLLRDHESPVRNAAIIAIGNLRDQESFDALVACLASSMPLERSNAVQSLVALNNPGMREPLVQALRVDSSPTALQAIIRTLSAFPRDAEVIAVLIATLTDANEDIRATAAVALAKMRASEAIAALQRMALRDTNHETTINGLWIANSSVARQAIEMIRSHDASSDLDWPD